MLQRNLQDDKVIFQRRDICPRLEESMRSSPESTGFCSQKWNEKERVEFFVEGRKYFDLPAPRKIVLPDNGTKYGSKSSFVLFP